ncbi:MAG: VIT1/CCC1 transporter family protein [Desulfurococcales archaeon]|nr:VIT1/CCC1 transporter family protein [Desulfurococcales archaeon]
MKSLKDELETAAIYAALSRRVGNPELSRKLKELAAMEGRHARFWADFLKRRGVDAESIKIPRWIITLKASILSMLGLGLTLKILEMGEREAIETYSKLLDSPELGEDERGKLRKVLEDELLHEEEFEGEESRFKEFLNHVRDAVLGMNDGLVEILSVSAGLAGAYGDPLYVALGGAIVGISGALSMGVGTYVSVKAQREVRVGVLGRVKLAAKYAAHILSSRISEYMRRKGVSDTLSEALASEASSNPDLLARFVGEEEYGLREETLENPRVAGLYTGLFYILGAFIPLLPYFLRIPIAYALATSFVLAGLMLSVSGSLVALSAGLSMKKKAMELVLSGLGSAAITYLIGVAASIMLGIEVS